MVPVINLRNEPKLREAFEYAHVHDNTVLIDRRTKWGNPFRIGPDQTRAQAIARYRVDLWRRIRAGEIALEELARLRIQLARLSLLSRKQVPWRGAGAGRGLGRRRPGGARCAAGRREPVMTGIAFKCIAPDESRIYDSTGCIIGEVYRQDDILKPGSHYFVVHLSEDYRGPHRVHDRDRSAGGESWSSSHPLWA